MGAIRRSARHDRRRAGIVVQGVGSMFQVVFADGPRPLRNYRELARADAARYAAFRHALLAHGVHCNSSGLACWFVSAPPTRPTTPTWPWPPSTGRCGPWPDEPKRRPGSPRHPRRI